jgi:hypothetical protein
MKQGSTAFWQKLVMPEEKRRMCPAAPSWAGGFRWFQSHNVVDLQCYRSPVEKERIRAVLLGTNGCSRLVDYGGAPLRQM